MKLKNVFAMSVATALLAATLSAGSSHDQYTQAAIGAAQWIESTSVPASPGIAWPADPHDANSVTTTLYTGTPGPILFFLEAYRYTKVDRYLTEAKNGADALLNSMASDVGTGLYEGIAGTGFTLGEFYLFTHDDKYRQGAVQCVDRLKLRARHVGSGIEWSSGNDIIAGGAGTGLFLLWASKELHVPEARDLAIQAGKRLVEVGESKGPGKTRWLMDAQYPEMPNFSHGTAGVAYFLTTLYLDKEQKEFLDAGLAGANYLVSIADTQGQICLIYHDDKHENLYYMSWCHGPAGVARLFYQLYRATSDSQWMEWMKRAAKAMIVSGAPHTVVTPGPWNNM